MRAFGFSLIFAFLALYALPAHPYSCVFVPVNFEGVSKQASWHDVIFLGIVVSVVDTAKSDTDDSIRSCIATLRVVEVMKGLGDEKEVAVSACSVMFVPDQKYLVFASYRGSNRELITSICSTTRILDASGGNSQEFAVRLWNQSQKLDLLRKIK